MGVVGVFRYGSEVEKNLLLYIPELISSFQQEREREGELIVYDTMSQLKESRGSTQDGKNLGLSAKLEDH